MNKKVTYHSFSIIVLGLIFFTVFCPFIWEHNSQPYYLLHWDFKDLTYPWWVYISNVIRSGAWPLWSPYVGAGTPFFLNPQTQLYSPLTLIIALLGGYSWYIAQIQSIFLLFSASVGAYVLSFTLWNSRCGAIVSALCFGLSSTLYGNLEHIPFIYGYALMPWFFLSIYQGIKKNNVWVISGFTVVLYFIIVTVYPGITLMMFLWGGMWGIFLMCYVLHSLRDRFFAFTRLLVGVFFALGLSAIYWLPLIKYFHEFTRGTGLNMPVALFGGNLQFKDIWGFFIQFLVTHPLPYVSTDVSMRGLYMGIVTLPLIAVVLYRKRDVWTFVITFFCVLSFLMACGGDFFGRVALHTLFPIFNYSRFPAGDSRSLMILGMALLAGRGMKIITTNDYLAYQVAKKTSLLILSFLILALFTLPFLYKKSFFEGAINDISISIFWLILMLVILPGMHKSFFQKIFVLILAFDLGTALHINISVAGTPTIASTPEPRQSGFQTIKANEPRKLGFTDKNIHSFAESCSSALSVPANTGYITKDFYLCEYNPLIMDRFDYVLNEGLGPWLQKGSRIAGWENSTFPSSLKDILDRTSSINFQILTYRPNEVVYDIHLKKKSVLIFNEMYFPGWRAKWNGNDVPMYEILGGLRALNMPPGNYILTTYFHPKIFFVALWISIVSLILGLLAISGYNLVNSRKFLNPN